MKKCKKLFCVVVLLALFVSAFSVTSLADSSTSSKGIDYSLVFDADYYCSTYSDLAAAFGNNRSALFNHFLNSGMNEGRVASPNFDFGYYYNKYADLRNVFGDNRPLYYRHYITNGYYEGRNASNPTVYNGIDYSSVYDSDYYIDHYSDLKAAFGDNRVAYLSHFVNFGMNEGRRACDTFDVSFYKSNNADLANAFGDNTKAYYIHFIFNGKREGRIAYNGCSYKGVSYDAVYNYYFYKDKYADLRAAFGDNIDMYIWHFVNFGMQEGRIASKAFNINVYKNYSDLVNAFGENNIAYFNHYMTYGYSEGRSASSNMIGIDVSRHNGTIDWDSVKNSGIEFAIIRLGYGDNYKDGVSDTSQDDAQAMRNIAECERLGIPYGVYLYSYAQNIYGSQSAQSEAAHVRRVLGNHNPALGIWYDVEDASQFGFSNDYIANIINEFFYELRDIDATKGIYANLNWWKNKLTSESLSIYKRWVAHWNVPACGYQGEYMLWQYTSDGNVNGISGRVDMNRYYK